MTTPVVELECVSFAYEGEPILDDVSMTVERGEFLAILGPNASGKSTLLKVILGLLTPKEGKVRVFGGTPRSARQRIGYVPQYARFDLDFPIRVREVVLMGCLRGLRVGRYSGEGKAALPGVLDQVGLGGLGDQPIGALSGGQLQRVLLARALIRRPELLLLDEPTASLDERIGRSIWDLFEELSHEMAVVIVSHDIGAVAKNVRKVACLNRRLFGHPSEGLSPELLEQVYGAPVDLVTHEHPHGHGHGQGRGT